MLSETISEWGRPPLEVAGGFLRQPATSKVKEGTSKVKEGFSALTKVTTQQTSQTYYKPPNCCLRANNFNLWPKCEKAVVNMLLSCHLSLSSGNCLHKHQHQHKGTCQKLLCGFFPLRGGEYPPFPLRVFGQDDFPLRGEGVPPIRLRKIPPKIRNYRSENYIFSLFFIQF